MKRMLCMAAALVAAAGIARAAGDGDGWKLGLQAWTLNKLTFAEAADQAAKLGLKYIESFPGQKIGGGIDGTMVCEMDAATQGKVLAMLKEKGVSLVNYGVAGASGEAGWRKLFAWAKAMGIGTIVSEPAEADLDTVSKLCDEFAINVAFHNHPQPSHYWGPDVVLKAVEGRSKRMGACADTGHWLRSGLDPIECLKKLEGRVISVHLKDLPEKGVKGAKDVPWGTGIANLDGVLKELKRQGFKGVFAIEYENWSATQIEEIGKCVAWFKAWGASACAAPAADAQLCAKFSADCGDVWARVDKPGDNDRWPSADPADYRPVMQGAQAKGDDASAKAAADGDKASAWQTGKKGCVEIALPAKQKVWFVGITAAGDDRKADPKKVVVKGSADGKEWQDLGDGNNLEFGKAGETKYFLVDRPGSYAMYRVAVEGNHGAAQTVVGEVELLAPK